MGMVTTTLPIHVLSYEEGCFVLAIIAVECAKS